MVKRLFTVHSGGVRLRKGLVKCFLKVPIACLGNTAAAVETNQWPVENSGNISQNLFHNLAVHTVWAPIVPNWVTQVTYFTDQSVLRR